MKYFVTVLLGFGLLWGCDRGEASKKDVPEPSCQEVVDRADQLAVEWAAKDGSEKAKALRSIIERERAGQETDPAVTLCEEQLSAEQKRCIMNAPDLVAKNECMPGE